MADLAAEAILHGLVAAGAVAGLLALWRVRAPGARLRFLFLAIVLPLLLIPLLHTVAPFRSQGTFMDRDAVFARDHWREVRLAGWPFGELLLGLLATVGVVLFLRDLLPLVRDQVSGEASHELPDAGVPEELRAEVASLAEARGLPPPELRLSPIPAPVLLSAGPRHPRIVVSPATLATLDREELRAGFAHELAHLARGDAGLGWLLMLVRAALFFDPVVQILARVAASEMERRADEDAAATTGSRLALAAALAKLASSDGEGPSLAIGGLRGLEIPGRILGRCRGAAVAARCRQLLEGRPPPPVERLGVRIAATAAGLVALLFFVV